MMQETTTGGPWSVLPKDRLPGQSVAALLALVGSKRLSTEDLRRRTRLPPSGFESLIRWLQDEYLVDVVSTLDGADIKEVVQLTERGEAFLLGLLEKTCELPELR